MHSKFIVLAILAFLANPAVSHADGQYSPKQATTKIHEVFEPEKISDIVTIALDASRENMGDIKKLYDKYMVEFKRYATKQKFFFTDSGFTEEQGQANQGYMPTREQE